MLNLDIFLTHAPTSPPPFQQEQQKGKREKETEKWEGRAEEKRKSRKDRNGKKNGREANRKKAQLFRNELREEKLNNNKKKKSYLNITKRIKIHQASSSSEVTSHFQSSLLHWIFAAYCISYLSCLYLTAYPQRTL